MIEKLYAGRRHPDGSATVLVTTFNADGLVRRIARLEPRLDLANHSPTGLEWGFGGSGPAQLALAMLADFFADIEAVMLHSPNRDHLMPSAHAKSASDRAALDLYQAFRHDVIAAIRAQQWEIRSVQVAKWVREQSYQSAALQPAGPS